MHAKDVLVDAFGRIREEVHAVVDDLSPDELNARVDDRTNSITWLVWHLTRVQDDHIADAFGLKQIWLSQDWPDRFALGLPDRDTGYGHTPQKVAKVHVDSGDLLLGYHDAVHEQTLAALRDLRADDLDRVVDANWSPPVTLGVRLISVLSDDLQHVGQAAFVRGMLENR
ncbi:DinB family protein [Streptomyces sp. NBC_00878]|uniref:mycothiol transferase n=1 Tax=Streptomyces sp. NBC_00878 TaxID=2975854 RepID=UPI00224CF651|nr:DinB family protein [Streptomyces sp. NBC_00878]MCX4903101.1 DinB family protein [Streptomyces sp. NBC_00878]